MDQTTNLYSNGFTQRLFVEPEYGASIERGGKRRCLGCMHLYDAEFDMCPVCGYIVNTPIEHPLLLQPGIVLSGKYMVGRALNFSESGAVYIAWDMELHRKVAVKEYLPVSLATRPLGQKLVTVFAGEREIQFESGLSVFVNNAVQLSKYRRESSVVTVYDVFEENKTAYVVRELLEGETFEDYLCAKGKLSLAKAWNILAPIAHVLKLLHKGGIVHLNIEPKNIIFTEKGEVKLVDYGSYKYLAASANRRLSGNDINGYLPEETCRSLGDYSAATDVYSLAAVIYRAVTGIEPAAALTRRAALEKDGRDALEPIEKYAEGLTKNQINAINNALNVYVRDRTQNTAELEAQLFTAEKVKRVKSSIKKTDKLKWPKWLKIAAPAAALASLAVCVLAITGVIGPKTGLKNAYSVPLGQTTVPDILSMNLIEAEKVLAENNLQFVVADAKANDYAAKDTVLLQQPDAGGVVNVGQVISLTVSSGNGSAMVEDVRGFAIETARELLESRGFKVVTRENNNSDYAKDVVYAQSIEASEQEKGTEITLYVSKGNSSIVTSTQVKIPNITKMDFDAAVEMLKSKGLYVAITQVKRDKKMPDNQIISQSPSGGKTDNAGRIITVTVSRNDTSIYVPDVSNMKHEAAVKLLEQLGFSVETRRELERTVAKGTVISQSVPSGSSVEAGTKISLTVSDGYMATVPDVSGKSLERAQELLMESGLSSCIKGNDLHDNKKYVVVSQGLKPGTKAQLGEQVELTVSSD